MANNGYDQTYEDDRKENEETVNLINKPLNAAGKAVKEFGSDLYDKVMGTKEQNAKAAAQMKEQDKRSPNTVQAKVNKVLGYKKGGTVRSSASKRADGIIQKGFTRA